MKYKRAFIWRNIKELLFAGWCTSIINLKLATGAETSLLTLSRTWQHAQIQVKLNSKWRHRLCCPRAGWRLAAAWLALVVRQRQDTQTRLIYSNTYGQCSEHVTLFALLEHWVNWKVHAQKKRWKKKWCWECSTFCYIWICAFFFIKRVVGKHLLTLVQVIHGQHNFLLGLHVKGLITWSGWTDNCYFFF